MNQKNSLGLNKCFLDLDNPFELFQRWFEEAKKKEINDPNALALGTARILSPLNHPPLTRCSSLVASLCAIVSQNR